AQPPARPPGEICPVNPVGHLIRGLDAVLRPVEDAQRMPGGLGAAERVERLVDVAAEAADQPRTRDGPPHAVTRPSCRLARARIRIALLPPKANALFCTTFSSAGRARFGTQSSPHSGSVRTWLMVGGMRRRSSATAQAMAARALAAPMVWPII